MILAKALLLRSDLQKRIVSLRERFSNIVLVQEGEEPAEDPAHLLEELGRVADELEKAIFQINKANSENTIEDGRTLTEALAVRDVLKYRLLALRTVIQNAKRTSERYSHTEIRWVRTVDVASLQQQIDVFDRQLRELNCDIQAANWRIEVDM